MNCGPNCGWDRSKAERSGIMINIQFAVYASEKLTYESIILKKEQKTKSDLTGRVADPYSFDPDPDPDPDPAF
jgi:hypothetical protein